ncbi:MAG TPA: hypothetical protein H9828_01770 [Candidatus Alistipes intestinigallinarum]|uniref:Uncharacterized protein n=1 Tax=Candidatus Alistipes intestinigallinarum TaxID=2838440 RepID=A0A9D1Z1Y6_9BACT|nr:hypothetical protein [Candidatus Alistipes intestinigallinarum]
MAGIFFEDNNERSKAVSAVQNRRIRAKRRRWNRSGKVAATEKSKRRKGKEEKRGWIGVRQVRGGTGCVEQAE